MMKNKKEPNNFLKEYEECKKELLKEKNIGEQIYESLCYVCRKTVEKIIEQKELKE